jgi:hypothetical protein
VNLVWNLDGIQIGSISINRWDGMQMFTTGWAFKNGNIIQWEATVTSLGWLISITRANGKIGELQGATFNLPLEIANVINRLA